MSLEDELPKKPVVFLYTDGSCLGNPGPGGWAFILNYEGLDTVIRGAEGEFETTNNRMELMAVIQGLGVLDQPSRVKLSADSQYVLNGMMRWMPGWKANGWRKKGGVIKNLDLWKQLDRLMAKHTIDTTWVKGHAGHLENEQCDDLAREQAEKYKALPGQSAASKGFLF